MTEFELFEIISTKKEAVASGDVTRFMVNAGRNYSSEYAVYPAVRTLENGGLPVENRNFSTISTDFSTALFYSGVSGNIHFWLT